MTTTCAPSPVPLTILRADALELPLPDASVDLVVTSPPYWGLRSYQDGGRHYDGQIGSEASPRQFLVALWAVMDELWRVVKPTGSVWVNLGDRYSTGSSGQSGLAAWSAANARGGAHTTHARPPSKRVAGLPAKSLLGLPWAFALGCIDPNARRAVQDPALLPSEVAYPQWILRRDLIWDKPNGLPESVRDRFRSSHEYWFHFTKSERYYSAVDLIREPHRTQPGREGAGALGGQRQLRPTGPNSGAYNPLGRLPGSVWSIASEPLPTADIKAAGFVEHYAAFPSEWPRRLVLGFAPTRGVCAECGEGLRPVAAAGADWACGCDTPGPTRPAVVLDPFGGTGTTAIVASALGCHGISIDLSHDYCRLAQWRAADGRLAARVRERTWPAPAKSKRARKSKVAPTQPGLFGGAAA